MFRRASWQTSPTVVCAFSPFSIQQTQVRRYAKQSHYDTLGVSMNATQQEIKDAYVDLSKKLHPDRDIKDTRLHQKFVKVNEAYEVLGKASRRQEYDRLLRNPTSAPRQSSSPNNEQQSYQNPYTNTYGSSSSSYKSYEEAAKRETYAQYRQRYYGKPYYEREYAERIYWEQYWKRRGGNSTYQERPRYYERKDPYTKPDTKKQDVFILFIFGISMAWLITNVFIRNERKRLEGNNLTDNQTLLGVPKRVPSNVSRGAGMKFMIEYDLGLVDRQGRRIEQPEEKNAEMKE